MAKGEARLRQARPAIDGVRAEMVAALGPDGDAELPALLGKLLD